MSGRFAFALRPSSYPKRADVLDAHVVDTRGALSDTSSRGARQPQCHLASVLCAHIRLVLSLQSVDGPALLAARSCCFSDVSQFPQCRVPSKRFSRKVSLIGCTARHGRDLRVSAEMLSMSLASFVENVDLNGST